MDSSQDLLKQLHIDRRPAKKRRPRWLLPAAVVALQDAVRADEAERERLAREAQARDEAVPEPAEQVTLRMRTAPFIDMLQHAMNEDVDVVWGV